jgi:hypothetical protein
MPSTKTVAHIGLATDHMVGHTSNTLLTLNTVLHTACHNPTCLDVPPCQNTTLTLLQGQSHRQSTPAHLTSLGIGGNCIGGNAQCLGVAESPSHECIQVSVRHHVKGARGALHTCTPQHLKSLHSDCTVCALPVHVCMQCTLSVLHTLPCQHNPARHNPKPLPPGPCNPMLSATHATQGWRAAFIGPFKRQSHAACRASHTQSHDLKGICMVQ